MTESERLQVDMFLDGALSEPESASLLERLENDPEAGAYLSQRALLHTDLRRSLQRRKLQQWAVAAAVGEEKAPSSRTIWRRTRPSWHSIAVAMIGLLIGAVTSPLVWAVIMPDRRIQVQRLLTESFEDPELTLLNHFPDVAGIWNGDRASIIHSETAARGEYVVRFGPAERRRYSHINRIVDVSGLDHSQGSGWRELRLHVALRAVEETPSTQQYTLRLAAFAKDAAGVKKEWFSGGGISRRALSYTLRVVESSRPGWVLLEGSLSLPPEARHLVISIGATPLNPSSPRVAYEADALSLQFVTIQEALP